MESLQLDVSLLRDFCKICRWVYIPCLAIRRDAFHPKMQMLTSGSGSRIASHAQSLTGIYIIASLDGNAAQVHVGTLILAAVISVVFYSD